MKRPRLAPQSTLHDRLRSTLRQARTKAGLSQRQLSLRFGSHPSLIARVERGERLLELGEFVAVFTVLGQDPIAVLAALLEPEDSAVQAEGLLNNE